MKLGPLWIPYLPPSSNQIYVTIPRKGRFLSKNASKFKIDVMNVLQSSGHVSLLKFKEGVPYELKIVVFFAKVINTGWVKGMARTKYKKIDLSNQIKLIEDTVASAIGIDDCHNFRLIIEKQCDPSNPGFYVTISEIPDLNVGLTKEAYDRSQLRCT